MCFLKIPFKKNKFAIDIYLIIVYNYIVEEKYADVAQMVAHLLGKEEVGGSSPLVSSTTYLHY